MNNDKMRIATLIRDVLIESHDINENLPLQNLISNHLTDLMQAQVRSLKQLDNLKDSEQKSLKMQKARSAYELLSQAKTATLNGKWTEATHSLSVLVNPLSYVEGE